MTSWKRYIIAIFLSAFLTQSFASDVSCLHDTTHHIQHEMHDMMDMGIDNCSSDQCMCTVFCNTLTLIQLNLLPQAITAMVERFPDPLSGKLTQRPKTIYHPPIA